MGSDDEDIKCVESVWSLTVLHQKSCGSVSSANKSMLMLMLVPLNQLNVYLLPQVQLPIKIL